MRPQLLRKLASPLASSFISRASMTAATTSLSTAAATAAGAAGGSASVASTLRYKKVPRDSLHVSKPTHWLESRFHFSFADHWDPKRKNFGKLRVVNDDIVKPNQGFGEHPHGDQEIFSYVVDGYLTHEDSKGNRETLGRGAVQYMSAGTGVYHSEMNEHATEACRFLQVWITPDARGLPVRYGSMPAPPQEQRTNLVRRIISGTGGAAPAAVVDGSSVEDTSGDSGEAGIELHQDVNVYIGELEGGRTASLPLRAGRAAYMVCIEGEVSLAGGKLVLAARDGTQLFGGTTGATLDFATAAGSEGAHFMVIELAAPGGQPELDEL